MELAMVPRPSLVLIMVETQPISVDKAGTILGGDSGNLDHPDRFVDRHVGPDAAETRAMLERLGKTDLDALIQSAVPEGIRFQGSLNLPEALSESQALAALRAIASKNQVFRSHIGMGYYDTLVPPVIQRNILENPGWYTQYTPYQAEISQGRLEGLLNFQTMVCDLTGLEIANASLLDEATAAAEAVTMCHRIKSTQGKSVSPISVIPRPSKWCAPGPKPWASPSRWDRTRHLCRTPPFAVCCCSIRTPAERCMISSN
jgi:hypothetical protein